MHEISMRHPDVLLVWEEGVKPEFSAQEPQLAASRWMDCLHKIFILYLFLKEVLKLFWGRKIYYYPNWELNKIVTPKMLMFIS